MARILLLLPTWTYQAHDFLAAAAMRGVAVTVGSDQRQALEDRTPETTLTLDFDRPETAARQALEFARRTRVHAVVGVDDDTSVIAAHVARALGLPHNTVESVETARDKHRRREVLRAAGLPYAWFERVPLADGPAAWDDRVRYPCVLKPLFLAASRGVIRADDPAQFAAAFRRIAAILADAKLADKGGELPRHLLVEGFLPGKEVALEGLLTDGALRVLALFDKPDPLDGPFFEETLYVTPSRLPAAQQTEIAATTARACAALGLRHGPIHAELRLADAGVCVLEVAPRVIGGLCARTLRFGTGVPLEELVLAHAVGEPLPALERERAAAGVMMLPIPRAGYLVEVRGEAAARSIPGIEDLQLTIRKRERVIPLPEGNRYLGFLFARGEQPEEVEAALRAAHAKLEFVIES